MISMRPGMVLGVLSLLLSSLAPAANTGHIQGYVLDEKGAPLPGAIVVVTGEGTVGRRHCHADETGFYRIPGLEASRKLTVSVHSPGRTAVQRTGYQLRSDQVLRLSFRLRPEGSRSILILVDATTSYHRRALEGVRSTLVWEPRVLEVRDESHEVLGKLLALLEKRPDGLIAIGTRAARLARKATNDLPVVHALVPDPERQGLVRGNMCGVPANGAFDEQMKLLRATAPEIRRLGTLYIPDRLTSPLAGLRDAAGRHGLELMARSLHSISDVEEALESLGEENIDAFFLFLDPELWTPQVVAAVGEFTRRRGILLLLPEHDSFRAAHGVTYVMGFDELGAFAGGLMNNILSRRTNQPTVGLVYPSPSLSAISEEEMGIIEEVRAFLQARRRDPPSVKEAGTRDHR